MARVGSAKIRRLLAELNERLQVPPNMLYRQVGAAVGLHPTTVFRHADGQLETAPRQLLEYLSEMALTLERGGEVVFTRTKLGTRVVPRALVTREVQRLLGMRIFSSKRSMLAFVEESLSMKPRSLERVYCSTRAHVLVDLRVLHFIKELIARFEYAPEAGYSVGDQIFHPTFGSGIVVDKEPKDKMAVEFADGRRQVLRERLFELREWKRRESWLDESEISIGQWIR